MLLSPSSLLSIFMLLIPLSLLTLLLILDLLKLLNTSLLLASLFLLHSPSLLITPSLLLTPRLIISPLPLHFHSSLPHNTTYNFYLSSPWYLTTHLLLLTSFFPHQSLFPCWSSLPSHSLSTPISLIYSPIIAHFLLLSPLFFKCSFTPLCSSLPCHSLAIPRSLAATHSLTNNHQFLPVHCYFAIHMSLPNMFLCYQSFMDTLIFHHFLLKLFSWLWPWSVSLAFFTNPTCLRRWLPSYFLQDFCSYQIFNFTNSATCNFLFSLESTACAFLFIQLFFPVIMGHKIVDLIGEYWKRVPFQWTLDVQINRTNQR